jgi:hypothetical protein
MTVNAQSPQMPSAGNDEAPATADVVARARLDGSLAANKRRTRAYFAGGVVSGATLAYVGTAIAYVTAGHAKVGLPTAQQRTIADSSETYRHAFTDAYARRVKQKRKSSALAGGVAGTAIMLIILVGPQIGRTP